MERRQSPGCERAQGGGLRVWAALCCLLLPLCGQAADAVARFACEAGVCGFNVIDSRLVVEPCAGRSVLVAYSESSGVTLLQCTPEEGSSENLVYLFDRTQTRGPALELVGIRFVKAGVLSAAAKYGVPDRFGAIALCVAPRPAEAGQLLMLARRPGPDPRDGDCFRVLRAVPSANGLDIRADDAANVPVRLASSDLWSELRRNLLPFIGPSN